MDRTMSGNGRVARGLRIALPAVLVATMVHVASAQEIVKVDTGQLRGVVDAQSKVRAFKGVPFAAPPVGALRWKAPQPAAAWDGVREATSFGDRCEQARVFDDMVFRDGMSEDCLYLNIWTPATSANASLPVMVWIYGGGFQAGSTSEPRQDGGRLAQKGVVVVSMNYRMGIFGFFAHPELTKESPHHASGNYAFMDQIAALAWVKKNVAAFGGNPNNVTIFGESAGSFAVSGLMAAPPAQGLFQRAIGESGAFFSRPGGTLSPKPLETAEQDGASFGEKNGMPSLEALRAKPAGELLQAASNVPFRFGPIIDGYVFPRNVSEIYAAGQQSHVPLLAGWNKDESRAAVTLATNKPTPASAAEQARKTFGDRADAFLKLYPASTPEEAIESAASYASDMFIGFATWKWIEAHLETGKSAVYRYSFDQAPPIEPGLKVNGVEVTAKDIGARHAGEIEYVFGALDPGGPPWQPEDHTVSDLMMSYWSNFAKTGDPNGPGVPKWPAYTSAADYPVMHIGTDPHAAPDAHRARYEFLDAKAPTAAPSSR
jgi:para-nitrobenzyl esterase